MSEFILAAASVFWLGILTAISPCPLATNVAAISFVSKQISRPRLVFLAGSFYALGRSFTYALLGGGITYLMLSTPELSHYLQKYTNMFLGPVLIIVGMILSGLINFNIKGPTLSHENQTKLGKSGMLGAFLLGVIFALTFCPIAAAIFFGSLLPITVKANSPIILPLIYGIATAFPVLIFAFSISLGAKKIAKSFNALTAFDKWARNITGVIFILVGVYYTLVALG
ncbi:MAG: aromatic aminobenezylarsenical efflux permease ArsG family transporter [Planctomycetota bacterium]